MNIVNNLRCSVENFASQIANEVSHNAHDAYDAASNTVSSGYRFTVQRFTAGQQYVTDGFNNGCQQVRDDVVAARDYVVKGIHAAGCYAVDSTKSACYRARDAAANFVADNSKELFYLGCTAVTAMYAPQLFLVTTLLTVAARIEITRQTKMWAQENMKPEKNPFNQRQPYQLISGQNLGFATLSALDSFALGTLYTSSSFMVNYFPMFGAMAFGSTLAKLILNFTDSRSPAPSPAVLNAAPAAPERA